MESKIWQQEMQRRSQPTSSTAINEGNIGNRVNRKRNRIGHSYRTRATLNEEQEDEEYENPNNASTASASSVSSNGNDSIATDIAHEEDLCSDSTTESSTEIDVEDRLSTSKPRSASSRNLRLQEISQDWKLACRQLLEILWQCEDSIPFREPVDRLEHPEYYQIIDTPMDLRTVKEDLLGDNYETPAEFAKDMKLIFTNSRNFNTNKCSRIYLMTIRLSAMFEDQMHRILLNWKSAHRRKSTIKRETKTKRKRKIQKKKPNLSNDTDSTTKSSTEIDVEDRPSTSKPRSASSRNLRLQEISQDWKLACRQLLETLWQCEDSIPFREPVDRLEHPEYYQIIDTPMDLRTVKEDLLGDNYETPAEFAKDMKLLFTNSRNFNTNKCSKIYLMTIRLSAMFEDQMHRILLNWKSAHRRKSTIKRETKTKRKRKIQKKKLNLSNDTDSTTKSSTEIDVEDRPSTSKPRSASSRNVRLQQISQDWKLACHKLLETLWQCEDSIYFREPMDRLELPEYYEIIDTPMDLRIVKEYLLGDNYETPVEFAKDVELILANSRNFNPNKHSSMHLMTIRLSAMFEEHMLRILLNWISARRREKTTKAKIKTNQEPNLKSSKSKSAPSDEETDVDVVGLSEHDDDDVSNKEQKKIKPNQKPNLRPSKSKSAPSDEEMDVDVVGLSEHDDDEVSDKEQKKKNFDISIPGPSQMKNSHTKLSNYGLFRRALKLRICRSTVAKKSKNSDSESETTSYTDSINSASVGTKARTAIPSISADTDSDSDYTSDDRRKQVRKNCGKNIKNGKQSKSKMTPNVIADDDNDNDEYVTESKMNEDNEEDEEVILVLDSTDEESKKKKIIKGDTRSQNLTPKSVQNQKYTNSGKNDNRDSESEEQDEEEEEEELKSKEEEDVEQQLQHKTKKYLLRSSRRSSSQKHSCYNEDSDDSTTLVKNRRKIKHRS